MEHGQWRGPDRTSLGPVAVPDRTDGSRTRWASAALGCTLTVILVIASGAVVTRREPSSAADDLAQVGEFVTSANTGRFEGTSRSEYGNGPDEPGSTSIDVSRLEGSFRLPDQLRLVEDSGDYVFESVGVATGTYFRSGDTRREMQDEPWVYQASPDKNEGGPSLADMGGGLDGAGVAAVSFAAGLSGAFGFSDLAEVLSELRDVRRVSPGVLEATMSMRDVLPAEMVKAIEEAAASIPADEAGSDDEEGFSPELMTEFLDDPVIVRLTHAGDGRLDEMAIRTESGEGEERTSEESTLKFSAWGEPVQITAPASGDVDPTPGIDEDDLAAFRDFPIVAPRTPPAGMVLDSVEVIDEDPEYESCASVDLTYGPSSATVAKSASGAFTLPPFLVVSVTEASCPWVEESVTFFDEGPSEAVRVGAYRGELQRSDISGRDEPEFVTVRFTVGKVIVDAETNLPQDQALAALATVGPLDLGAQPIERSEPPPG